LTDYREKARALKITMGPMNDTEIDAIAAAMKEVAEEAVKAEHEIALTWHRQNMELAARNVELSNLLAVFTSATPDSPEVMEALALSDRWQGESVAGLPAESALTAAIILVRALRAAQVEIAFAAHVRDERDAAQARLAEAETAQERAEAFALQDRLAKDAAEAKLAAMTKERDEWRTSWAEVMGEARFEECHPQGMKAKVATLTAALGRAREELLMFSNHEESHGPICSEVVRASLAALAALPPLPAADLPKETKP
jgi:hypothetical protein